MTRDYYSDVEDFHDALGIPVRYKPQIPPTSEANLREALISEEYDELIGALRQDDLVGIADGLADLIYVAIGTALSYGIPLDRVWDEVHRTNMLKQGGGGREDGKILKPAGWTGPRIAEILEEAR